ncbi:MAG TPA: nitronate monooxygenase [Nocardioides sp.]|nr:nitronate monooxygenase [Nocardioides sp.]
MSALGLGGLPVLAAPMAGGPSTPALVVAAAKAGSYGFLPAGYRSAAQLAGDLAAVRASTDELGVNLFVPDEGTFDRAAVLAYRDRIAAELERVGIEVPEPRWSDDDDWRAKVDLLVERPVPWVSFTFGLPDRSAADRLRRAGSRLLATVTDVDEAAHAVAFGVDGLVVQSSEAGGHRGTFDQHRTPNDLPLADLVAQVRAVTGLPVVAAGGVVEPGQVAGLLHAGAAAVQVGTALLLADEAGTKPVHRAALTDPEQFPETVPMRAFTGRVARGLRNRFSATYDAGAPVGYPAVHHLTAPLRAWAAAHGEPHLLHLWAGTGHRRVRSGPAGSILAALVP